MEATMRHEEKQPLPKVVIGQEAGPLHTYRHWPPLFAGLDTHVPVRSSRKCVATQPRQECFFVVL
eukprot:1215390-Alexandrium_andersonii.AAC.1